MPLAEKDSKEGLSSSLSLAHQVQFNIRSLILPVFMGYQDLGRKVTMGPVAPSPSAYLISTPGKSLIMKIVNRLLKQVYRPHPVSGAETMSTTDFDRREFLKTTTVAAGTVAATGTSSNMMASDPGPGEKDAESIVKLLFENLKPEQKQQICFEWDHQDKERGLLRTRVANNWQVTKPSI
ncbi:twin-arginine translocation signal domain-containing protein, partial [bacterium]|nr:twin-arginine translocation signal domain-containing protein [bacterium]